MAARSPEPSPRTPVRRGDTAAPEVVHRRPWRTLVAVCVAAAALTGLAPLAQAVTGGDISAMDLLSDAAELTGAPWYLGALSTVTVLVWAAGAALHLVAALAIRRRAPRLATALGALAVFTLAWTVDDLLLLHEIVLPWLLGLGQEVTFALYGLVLVAILARFRRSLAHQAEAGVLVLALVALGGSVLLDVIGWDLTVRRVAEEGLKVTGALAWAVFPAQVLLRAADGRRPPTDG